MHPGILRLYPCHAAGNPRPHRTSRLPISHKKSDLQRQRLPPTQQPFAPFASAVHHLRVSHSNHPRKPLNPLTKTTRQRRHCKTAHFALRFGPFHKLKRPISHCEMGRFATCFLLNQNTLIINVLHARHYFFLMTLSTCEAKLLIPFTDGCPLFLSMSLRRITGTP